MMSLPCQPPSAHFAALRAGGWGDAFLEVLAFCRLPHLGGDEYGLARCTSGTDSAIRTLVLRHAAQECDVPAAAAPHRDGSDNNAVIDDSGDRDVRSRR